MSRTTKYQRMLILLAVLSFGLVLLWYNEYSMLQLHQFSASVKTLHMGDNPPLQPKIHVTATRATMQNKEIILARESKTDENRNPKSPSYSTPIPKSVSPVSKNQQRPKVKQVVAKNHPSTIKAAAAPIIIERKKPPGNTSEKIVSKNQSNKKKKYLIFLCDNRRWCGGWGDRQRGIVTVFLMSLAYNRTFGIEMTSPCDFTRFMQPNQTNWIIPPQELVNRTTKIIDAMGAGPPRLEYNGTNFEDVIKIKINSDGIWQMRKMYPKQMPKYVHGVSRAIVFRRVWKHLMKPSQHIITHLKQMSGNVDLNNRTHQLVCAHLRIGKSKTLPNDSPRVNISSIEKLWTFLHSFEDSSKIFIATDNEEVRVSAKKNFGPRYFDTGGKILHIDRQRWSKEACLGFETAILDQIILTSCDVLVVSPSNFSVRAAMLKDLLKSIYMFGGKEVHPFTPKRRRRSVMKYQKLTLDLGHKLLVVYVL